MWSRLKQRNEWKFFAVLPRAAPGLAVLWWVGLVLRGVLPALFAIAMGALVGAVQHGDPLAAPLAFVGAIFVLLQVLGPTALEPEEQPTADQPTTVDPSADDLSDLAGSDVQLGRPEDKAGGAAAGRLNSAGVKQVGLIFRPSRVSSGNSNFNILLRSRFLPTSITSMSLFAVSVCFATEP